MERSVLITGAGGALAPNAAAAFAGANWRLALAVRSESSAARVRDQSPKALILRGDLAVPAEAARLVAQAEEELGALRAVVHLAGGFDMAAAVHLSDDAFEKQLNVNLRPVVNVTRAVLPGMLERGEGFILGVAAKAALEGGERLGAYASAKAAVSAYLKSVAAEVDSQGVAVTVLYPMGAIDTQANRAAMPKADPATLVDPDELCQAMLFAASRGPRGRVRELMVHAKGGP